MTTKEDAPEDRGGVSENTDDAHDDSRNSRAILAATAGYCVVVESSHDRYRRRVYLSLNAAERAVNRARHNGKFASLVLATINPVGVIE